MPGRHVTDHQMRLYMKFRQTNTTAVAAARASISTATAYRIGKDPRLPSQKQTLRERRRPDPLADIFEAEVVPLLKAAPGIRCVAIFEEMIRRHPALGDGFAARWRGGSVPGAPSMVRSGRSFSGRPTCLAAPACRILRSWGMPQSRLQACRSTTG